MELGSNFEIDFSNLKYAEDNIFEYLKYYHCIYTDSGRSASAILNSIINIEEGIILLPSYICNAVIEQYKDFSIEFYKVNKDLSVDIQDLERKINSTVKVIYLMHYFGKTQSQECMEYLEKKKQEYNLLIIEDTTHSIFTERCTIGDYCICSLRKWFPIPDGGVLYTKHDLDKDILYNTRKKDPSVVLEAMVLKKWYIKEQLQCNHIYRHIFEESEKELETQKEILQISDISRSIMECISIKDLIEKRKQNYRELARYLCGSEIKNIFEQLDFVPFAYPVYIDNRDEFRQYLMKRQIYCAIHWPIRETILENNIDANVIYQKIISFPIDQRYDSVHIEYLNKTIQDYLHR